MRIVLPPSETKQPGGDGPTLDLSTLAHPETTELREALLHELATLSADTPAAMKALKLGAKGEALLAGNLTLTTQPTMPAICRYTGVVYDALNYDTLSGPEKKRAGELVWVFSALFGPLRADDLIPHYRLSADSRLPGEKLASRWAPYAETLWAGDFTLDLRSEAYRALAPLTPESGVFVKVVTDGATGRVAVGHANKATKGRLVRDLLTSGVTLASVDDVVSWGESTGYGFEAVPDAAEEVWLVVR
jgi:cytoplasmic iron level regulating protein YaaA (DUF328/UPF0246 family)